MSKFKVGDRVKRLEKSLSLIVGRTYCVSKVPHSGWIQLEGASQNYDVEYFELAEEKDMKKVNNYEFTVHCKSDVNYERVREDLSLRSPVAFINTDGTEVAIFDREFIKKVNSLGVLARSELEVQSGYWEVSRVLGSIKERSQVINDVKKLIQAPWPNKVRIKVEIPSF